MAEAILTIEIREPDAGKQAPPPSQPAPTKTASAPPPQQQAQPAQKQPQQTPQTVQPQPKPVTPATPTPAPQPSTPTQEADKPAKPEPRLIESPPPREVAPTVERAEMREPPPEPPAKPEHSKAPPTESAGADSPAATYRRVANEAIQQGADPLTASHAGREAADRFMAESDKPANIFQRELMSGLERGLPEEEAQRVAKAAAEAAYSRQMVREGRIEAPQRAAPEEMVPPVEPPEPVAVQSPEDRTPPPQKPLSARTLESYHRADREARATGADPYAAHRASRRAAAVTFTEGYERDPVPLRGENLPKVEQAVSQLHDARREEKQAPPEPTEPPTPISAMPPEERARSTSRDTRLEMEDTELEPTAGPPSVQTINGQSPEERARSTEELRKKMAEWDKLPKDTFSLNPVTPSKPAPSRPNVTDEEAEQFLGKDDKETIAQYGEQVKPLLLENIKANIEAYRKQAADMEVQRVEKMRSHIEELEERKELRDRIRKEMADEKGPSDSTFDVAAAAQDRIKEMEEKLRREQEKRATEDAARQLRPDLFPPKEEKPSGKAKKAETPDELPRPKGFMGEVSDFMDAMTRSGMPGTRGSLFRVARFGARMFGAPPDEEQSPLSPERAQQSAERLGARANNRPIHRFGDDGASVGRGPGGATEQAFRLGDHTPPPPKLPPKSPVGPAGPGGLRPNHIGPPPPTPAAGSGVGSALGAAAGPIAIAFAAKYAIDAAGDKLAAGIRGAGDAASSVAALDPRSVSKGMRDFTESVSSVSPAANFVVKQFNAVADASGKFREALMGTAESLKYVSGPLSAAFALREVAGIQGDFRRARKLEEPLSRLVTAETRLEQSGKDALATLLKPFLERLVPLMETAATGLEAMQPLIEVGVAYLERTAQNTESSMSILSSGLGVAAPAVAAAAASIAASLTVVAAAAEDRRRKEAEEGSKFIEDILNMNDPAADHFDPAQQRINELRAARGRMVG